MAAKHGQSLPHLLPGEVTLLGYAADDSRDIVTLADKEALVLELAHQIQEQRLEKALLEQGTVWIVGKFFAFYLHSLCAHFFLLFSILTYFRARVVFWRQCGRTARGRGERVPRSASYIHRQEESRSSHPHD